jgi:hypothetical protein
MVLDNGLRVKREHNVLFNDNFILKNENSLPRKECGVSLANQ